MPTRLARTLRFLAWPALGGLIAGAVIIALLASREDDTGTQLLMPPTPDASTTVVMQPAPTAPAPALPSGPASYADAVERAAPAVVNIYTSKTIETPINPLFADPRIRQYFGIDRVPTRKRMESSLGSGVIISAQGYVLTNHHVVADADEIVIALRDGREARATVVGSDPDTDLAVLRVQLPSMPEIKFRDSASLRIGDVVLAIGNPFGVGQTVTIGIVSAMGRSELGINTFEDFIQTDAAINPGNSGGALVDAHGELVGVNSAIFSKSGGYQGIGFAIPTRIVRQVFDEIVRNGRVIRGWLGVEPQALTPELAHALGMPDARGVVVSGLVRNGPAHLAGLLPGDIVSELGGKEISSPRAVIDGVAALKPGTKIRLTVLRAGKKMTMDAVVSERPAQGSPTRE